MLNTYTTSELQKILEDHRKWLQGDPGGSHANLSGAYLSHAYLSHANLSHAYLSHANLSRAYLSGANLSHANLSRAYLSGANLSGANLSGANLSGANLSGANLSHANLSGANLSGANLSGANLDQIKGVDESTMGFWPVCPTEGDVIGWKKCADGVIVKLLIGKDVVRSSATTRKCRAASAEVLAVFGGNNQTARSMRDGSFVYRKGETVTPNEPFNTDRWNECSTGIHFFITREEAEAYSR